MRVCGLLIGPTLMILLALPLGATNAPVKDDPVTITSVPREMSYHGILKDSAGDPVEDSVYNVFFRIFNAESGGLLLWAHIIPCTTSVGYFDAIFSDVNLPFDEDYWLELEIDSEVLDPRQKICMVGYAARADTADYALNTASGDIYGWIDDGTIVRLESSTDSVGIGTASPSEKLEVVGNLLVNGSKATIGYGNTNTGSGTFVAGYSNEATGICCVVGGGNGNSAIANYSVVAGGTNNIARYNYSVVSGGSMNVVDTTFGTIGGGYANTVESRYGIVTGGSNNMVSGDYAAICGGRNNDAVGLHSIIAGGSDNMASNLNATISGGEYNSALNDGATVGGGRLNIARGVYSVIAGGGGPTNADSNNAMGNWSSISGGHGNTTAGEYSSIGGGAYNSSVGSYAAIGGGKSNDADSAYSFVGGGRVNAASDSFSAVLGGEYNSVSNKKSAICGGRNNTVSGYNSIIGSGSDNTASGNYSVIGGGYFNVASASYSAVLNGSYNTASGQWSSICAGDNNTNAGDRSVITGGYDNTLTDAADYSMAFGSGVYLENDHRVAFYKGSSFAYSGRIGINRDDNDGGINYPLHIGTITSNGNGAYLTAGGTWTNGSSRAFKENFRRLEAAELISKISSIQVTSWSYKNSDEKHIGPVAEDFVAAFDVGVIRESDNQRENQYLAASDVAGVALAGVKELIDIVNELKEENEKLRQEINELKQNVR